FARRINGGDPRLLGCVDGRYVGGRDPAVADDAEVVFLHKPLPPVKVDVRLPREPTRVVVFWKIEQRDMSVAIHKVPAALAAVVVPDALGLRGGVHTAVAGVA